MGNQEKSINIDYCVGWDLLRFENICYLELIKLLVDVFKSEKKTVTYGNEEGLNTYLSVGLQLDASVFLYEAIKHMNSIVPQETEVFMSSSEFKTLEIVRNNVHTFFKEGKFALKASEIIDNALKEYELKEPDFFFALRNDISLVFEITNHTRQLIGCDYFIHHCVFECNGQKWCGEDYKHFADYLSSHIKAFAESIDETCYQLQSLSVKEERPQVELFDYKSCDLFSGSNLSDATAFRLMLMLFQISYGILLVEKVLSFESYKNDDLWICFVSKLLAIKYDESIDNLLSLLQYAPTKDQKVLCSKLSESGFDAYNLLARDFARNLRNTIHYQELQYKLNLISEKTTRNHILTIYLSNTEVQTIQEFREMVRIMFDEMKGLQMVIRKIMSVDKTYGC